MQTYTHLLIGATVAAVAFSENEWAQIACIAGAIAPDLVFVPFFLVSIYKRKKVTAEEWGRQPKLTLIAKEVSHSIIVWWTLAAMPWWLITPYGEVIFAALLNYSIHLGIDLLTHSARGKFASDQGMAWPFKIKLGHYLCLWEYRTDHGLRCTPIEALIDLALLVITGATLWKLATFSFLQISQWL